MKRTLYITKMILFCACAPAVAPQGCDGTIPEVITGDNGVVTFSTLLDYPEIDNPATANIAVGLPFPFAIEAETDLTITVTPADPAGSAQLLSLGPSQFVLFLNVAGQYTIDVLQDGQSVDTFTFVASNIDHIRLSSQMSVITDGDDCDTLDNVDSLASFVLHENQFLATAAVPVDAAGTPLLGMLTVNAETTSPVVASGFSFGGSATANTVLLQPYQVGGADTASVTITVENFSEAFPLSFGITRDTIEPVCQ